MDTISSGARLIWRGPGTLEEQSVPMAPLGNDRWRAEFTPLRTGRHRFNVEAWLDEWASYQHDLGRKKLAGDLEPIDVEEGRRRLLLAAARVPPRTREALPGADWLVPQLEVAEPADALELLLSDAATALMGQLQPRAFVTHLPADLMVDVERLAAGFASWYEMFPRSQCGEPSRTARSMT